MTESFVMMALGAYRFSLPTAAFQRLDRTSSYRWEAVDRVGMRPAQQFIGPGEDTLRIDGTIYPSFRGGLGQVSAMRAEAAKGEPLQLIDGTGRVWGWYCITEVGESQETFFSNGVPRKVDFNLSLTMYGGNEDDLLRVLSESR